MKLNKNQTYWALVKVQNNGSIKVQKAKKLVRYNQYRTTWQQINARDLARAVSQSQLVTR